MSPKEVDKQSNLGRISYIFGQLKALRAENVMRIVLNEDGDAAFGAVEGVPESESDGSGDAFLGGGVFDGAELFEPSDDEIVGENSAFVVAAAAIGDQAALVQRHHHVYAVAVYFCPQCSGECHLQAVGRWPLERRL